MMEAFSLLGKRAFFVTQGPGTIMFRLRCFVLVFFLTTWQVLQSIFVSFLFGEGSYLTPNLEELERMNGE